MKLLLTLFATAVILFNFNPGDLSSGPVKPPLGYSGAPGESYCTDCHSGTPLNGGGGNVSLSFSQPDNTYKSGHTYKITVKVTDPVQSPLCGFETTVLSAATGNSAGVCKLITPENTMVRTGGPYGRTYVTNYQGPAYSQWSFKWKAPSGSTGPITIYTTGNATNNDFTPQGDHIYSTNLTITPAGTLKIADDYASAFSVYPTLFHQQVTAHYQVDERGEVQIILYNLQGQEQETLYSSLSEEGQYEQVLTLNRQHAPGIYLLMFKEGTTMEVQKVMIQ